MENVAVCIILYIILNTGLFVAANFMTNFTRTDKDEYTPDGVKWGQIGNVFRIMMTTLSGVLFPIALIYHNTQFSAIDYISLVIIMSVMHIALYKITKDRYSFAFLALFLIVSLVTTATYNSPI